MKITEKEIDILRIFLLIFVIFILLFINILINSHKLQKENKRLKEENYNYYIELDSLKQVIEYGS